MEVSRCSLRCETRAPGGHTNAYVLGGGPVALVDPARRTPELDRLVRHREVEAILVTHTHPDHVGAVADYAAETGATVWARRGHADRFREATGFSPDRTLSSETTIALGAESLAILDAPGHAPDHVAIRAGPAGPICCGDCVLARGSVVVGAPEGDMRAYLSTLRRLWAIDPPRLYPGHGPAVDRPRETIERLIHHRLERERRVLAAVEAGVRTVDEVLEAAYEKDLTGVRDLARATVVAHLEKLAVEGSLWTDGEHVRPR